MRVGFSFPSWVFHLRLFLFGMGAIKAQDLSRHVFVVCFVSPFVHSPELFRSSSIPKYILHGILWIIRYFFLFFLWWWDFQRMWWHQIFLYFSCLTGTLNVANLLFFLEEKKCMTQQQPHIVLTILTPFFVFPHNSILLFHIKKTFWKGKLFYNFKWHICSFVTQELWVMVNFN